MGGGLNNKNLGIRRDFYFDFTTLPANNLYANLFSFLYIIGTPITCLQFLQIKLESRFRYFGSFIRSKYSLLSKPGPSF